MSEESPINILKEAFARPRETVNKAMNITIQVLQNYPEEFKTFKNLLPEAIKEKIEKYESQVLEFKAVVPIVSTESGSST
ncbi:hypothetical protein WDW89_25245, partial [Deltaproteobacteria bacterium TL4]